MKKQYDLLLVGATALSAGIVQAHPELKIAVLEQTCSVAGEFANTYCSDNAFFYTPETALARQLKAQFLSRKAMEPEGEWIPAIMPIVSDVLQQSRADVYFFATVTHIAAEEEGYLVRWNAFGIAHSFRVKKIIDTTAGFVTNPYFSGKAPQCSVALHHMDTDHRVYSTPCTDPVSGRFAILNNYQNILRIASEVAVTPLEQDQQYGAAAWIPSAARGNFLQAFDNGVAAELPEGEISARQPAAVNDGDYDLIVVGLGTAGAIAAITARQEGLKVLGVENLSVCGGAGTAGNVVSYYYGYKGGVYREIDEASQRYDDRFIPMNQPGVDQKIAQLNSRLSGCDVRLNACFTEAICENNTVTGIVWYENGLRHSATARFVIDATAEAAVCVSAGCEMLAGRTSDGHFQPYSCRYLRHTDGKLLGRNIDQGRMDQYDPDSLGKGILQTYSSYLHLLQDYSSKVYLGISTLFGVRQGRRIRGEETVEFAKITAGQFCQKPVYWCWSNFDNHGKDLVLESTRYQDWVTLCGMWGWGLSVPVPMGALIPKGYNGLLAAGRCVSVDHDTAFAVRMKDDVQKCGEVAAQLAALAIAQKIPARAVAVDTLRQRLFRTGCLKPENETPKLEKQKLNESYEGKLWCDDDNAIARGLATDAPAYYMWSAAVLNKKPLLTQLLDSPEENTRFHAALALSMLPVVPEKAVQVLAECALRRDGYIPQSGRKYVFPRAISAIYALGKTASVLALPALYSLMNNEDFVETLPFEPSQLLTDREDYRFQYRSYIIWALCRIAEKNPEAKADIRKRLLGYMEGKTLSVSLVGGTLRFDDTETFCKMVEDLL